MARRVIIISIIVIQALILATIFCCPSMPLSPQSGGKVGSWKLNSLGYAGSSVNPLALVDGFTNLYSSITANPNIILSIICDRNMAITINATSAIIPKMDDMNSSFRHPSACFINHLNSLWAFQY